MWFHPVSVKKNIQTYIWPKLCLTPEIKSKYFRTGECVGIGQTTVLVNCLGGLSLPRKSVVRLTDRPDMTLDVYRGRKTTMQQQQQRVHQGFYKSRVGNFDNFYSFSYGEFLQFHKEQH